MYRKLQCYCSTSYDYGSLHDLAYKAVERLKGQTDKVVTYNVAHRGRHLSSYMQYVLQETVNKYFARSAVTET